MTRYKAPLGGERVPGVQTVRGIATRYAKERYLAACQLRAAMICKRRHPLGLEDASPLRQAQDGLRQAQDRPNLPDEAKNVAGRRMVMTTRRESWLD